MIRSISEIWEYLEKEVFSVPSTKKLFNQYNTQDQDPKVDLPNAATIRKNNLQNYLECFKEKPNFLIVAEAPGPWGARFSGVPLTTEEQLCSNEFPFRGEQSSKCVLPQPGGISSCAQTAKIFWSVMQKFHPKFFAWDAVPFHPHKEGNGLSIRNPTKSELHQFSDLLRKVHSAIEPEITIAVGKKAKKALEIAAISPIRCVRHPAHGGKNKFKEEITEILACA